MPIKFQEKDSDRCEGASRFKLCHYKYLHKEACTIQKKAAVMKYLHMDKYLDINKLSNFIPCILKSSPRKERGERDNALDQGITTGLVKPERGGPGSPFQEGIHHCHSFRGNLCKSQERLLPAQTFT